MLPFWVIGVRVQCGQLLKVFRVLGLGKFLCVSSDGLKLRGAPQGRTGAARQPLQGCVVPDTLLHPP